MLKAGGLTRRITGLFILLAVISSFLSSTFFLVLTKQQFAGYVDEYNQDTAQLWIDRVLSYYLHQGSLNGVQEIFTISLAAGHGFRYGTVSKQRKGRRLVITDLNKQVVADSANLWLGQTMEEDQKQWRDFPLEVSGKERIGTLYIKSPLTVGLSSLENEFISNITRQVVFSTVLVTLFALFLGLLLARQITIPLGELSTAIHRLAKGELRVRVEPRGNSELASLAADFNLMADQLYAQESNRRRLVSDIAHELRTPLALLRGQLEAMQSGTLAGNEEVTSMLVDEVIRLTRLVKDLENIGLAESGALQLDIIRLDINDLLEKLTPLRMTMEDKGIDFQVKVDRQVKYVDADINRLLQILINLLSNAISYSASGDPIKLEIYAAGQDIAFSIQDYGPGVSAEHLPRVFDRFYRADDSRSRQSGGRGLGLAIARSYTEAHGGKIWVESEPGQGAVFRFTIPRNPAFDHG